MSSSKSMIWRSIKHRLGWTIVIAAAGVATALVMGNSWVAAAVAIMVVVLVSALIPDRKTRVPDASSDDSRRRSRGAPYLRSYAWKVSGQPDLSAIAQALGNEGLVLKQGSRSAEKVVLRGGSQLWSRLLGGYFVDPKRLPIGVEVGMTASNGSGGCTVEAQIRDRFGIAVRDEALEDRFLKAAAEVGNAVEGRLTAAGFAIESRSTSNGPPDVS